MAAESRHKGVNTDGFTVESLTAGWSQCSDFPSVLWQCWFNIRHGVWGIINWLQLSEKFSSVRPRPTWSHSRRETGS